MKSTPVLPQGRERWSAVVHDNGAKKWWTTHFFMCAWLILRLRSAPNASIPAADLVREFEQIWLQRDPEFARRHGPHPQVGWDYLTQALACPELGLTITWAEEDDTHGW